MKRYVAYILLILLPVTLSAEERTSEAKRLTFGAEWGYICTFFGGYHNNFYSPDGWRVDENEFGGVFYNNVEVYIHIGYNFGEKWNLSLYTGYAGVQGKHHCIPFSIRGTRFFNADCKGDRWFSFIDLGSGISIKKRPQEILTGKVGGGYRISLSERTKLDFLASLRATYSHTDIIFGNTEISHDRINRNNAYGCSVSLGVSLSF